MSTTSDTVLNSSMRRGRRPLTPTTKLGVWLQQQLDLIPLTRAEFAKRLYVSPSTVGRLLNGDTRVVQKVSVESICEALRLEEIDRRVFLQLVATATTETFAFATGAQAPTMKKQKIDLDLADDHAEALHRLRDRGDAQYVMQSAHRWYEKLYREQPTAKDTRYASTQIRFGILLGAAQESGLSWSRRGPIAIRTYKHVEEAVIYRYNLNTFRQEYANLLSHSAPLYREIGKYEEGIQEFNDALYWVERVDDPLLRANLLRSRAHIWAAQGEELRWRYAIEEARRDALLQEDQYSEMALGMVGYVTGEGYKRFAFTTREELPLNERIRYANLALESFAQSRDILGKESLSYYMLAGVSEAQCLVWVDPEEALRRLGTMREQVKRLYPSLLEKMKRTEQFAHKRLLLKRGELLPQFNLDTR